MLDKVLTSISKDKIGGFLPLDIVFHFSIGLIITSILLRFIKPQKAFLVVFLIALLKELYDSTALTASLTGHLVDILFTILFPLGVLIREKVKAKS